MIDTGPDLDSNKWENLSLSDLAHINKYAREKVTPLGQANQTRPFYALNVNWVGIISPGIPSGR